MSNATSWKQHQKCLQWENGSSVLSFMSCVTFIYTFSIECVMAIDTFEGYSIFVTDITNSNLGHDSRQFILRQFTTIFCTILVVFYIVTDLSHHLARTQDLKSRVAAGSKRHLECYDSRRNYSKIE